MNNHKDEASYCPSYIARPGAKLYGIVNNNGFINYLKDTIEVNEEFIIEASRGREPEKRFRFAGNCAKNGCKQWEKSQHECGLIDKIILIVNNAEIETLQNCPIRSKCRWFQQRKGLACAQCNEIIRNIEAKMVEL